MWKDIIPNTKNASIYDSIRRLVKYDQKILTPWYILNILSIAGNGPEDCVCDSVAYVVITN